MAEHTGADVELVAQANFASVYPTPGAWDLAVEREREDYRVAARAVLSALSAAGRLRDTDMSSHEEQLADRDRAARVAMFAVDDAMLRDRETAEAIRMMTPAMRSRIAVEAALGYLIGAGLISVLSADQWPRLLSLETPEHLRPDLDGMIERDRSLRAATWAALSRTEPTRED